MAAIYLALPSLTGSKRPTRLYSDERHTICVDLHPMRFAMRPASLQGRWALTSPFHLYPRRAGGSLFSVALAVFTAFKPQSLPVRKHGVRWCSDFPPPLIKVGRLPGNAYSFYNYVIYGKFGREIAFAL